MASRGLLLLFLSLSFFLILCFANLDDPSRLVEEQGYLKREHSLGKPYQGRGMEVNYDLCSIVLYIIDYIRFLSGSSEEQQLFQMSIYASLQIVRAREGAYGIQ